METVILKDGRKVEVVAKVNNKEFIAREIFIDGWDIEYASGDNFVALYSNVELKNVPTSYKQKEEARLVGQIELLKKGVAKLQKQYRVEEKLSKSRKHLDESLSNITNSPEIKKQLEMLEGFINQSHNWVVYSSYGTYKLLTPEQFCAEKDDTDNDLVYARKITLDITNQYKPTLTATSATGSSGIQVAFFETHEEAKNYLSDIINKRILTYQSISNLNTILHAVQSHEITLSEETRVHIEKLATKRKDFLDNQLEIARKNHMAAFERDQEQLEALGFKL
jgi:hypothetical protein